MMAKSIMLSEQLDHGQHIHAFTIELESDENPGRWHTLHEGGTIGRRKLVLLDRPVPISARLRVCMQGYRGKPALIGLGLFPMVPGQ